jgi:hypothetical protein
MYICAVLCTNQMYRFSPAANSWSQVYTFLPRPSARRSMGFAATPDGMLYVLGGDVSITGNENGDGRRGGKSIRYVYMYTVGPEIGY